MNPDSVSLAQPAEQASTAGKRQLPEAHAEGEVVTILVLVASGSERKAEPSRPQQGLLGVEVGLRTVTCGQKEV